MPRNELDLNMTPRALRRDEPFMLVTDNFQPGRPVELMGMQQAQGAPLDELFAQSLRKTQRIQRANMRRQLRIRALVVSGDINVLEGENGVIQQQHDHLGEPTYIIR